MSLRDQIPFIIQKYEEMKPRLKYNYELFDSYEGSLLKYILEDIRKQVSDKSFKSIEPRVVPINFLKKLIDKLSQIYNESPERTLLKNNPEDQALFEIYQALISIDVFMQLSNEIFNLEKYVFIKPYASNGAPKLRVMQPDKFFVISTSQTDPTDVTHYVEIMGRIEREVKDGKESYDILHVYTDQEFLVIDTSGEVLNDEMKLLNNEEGINYVGKIPGVYIAKSRFDLIPREDSDLFKMVKILPILFSDLNEVVFWQSFSVIYGIDLTAENLEYAPNAFWNFKSDPNSNTKPSVNTIKPEADISEVMNFIIFQLNTWLNTRGIKSFAVGQNTQQINASGFSKIVDEIDTSEDRKKQIPFFQRGEYDLWDLIMNYMHPYWIRNKMVDMNKVFTPGQKVLVRFPEQLGITDPMQTRAEIEKDINLGLTTRVMALMKLNKRMTEQEAIKLLEKIDEENTIEVKEDPNGMDENKDSNT